MNRLTFQSFLVSAAVCCAFFSSLSFAQEEEGLPIEGAAKDALIMTYLNRLLAVDSLQTSGIIEATGAHHGKALRRARFDLTLDAPNRFRFIDYGALDKRPMEKNWVMFSDGRFLSTLHPKTNPGPQVGTRKKLPEAIAGLPKDGWAGKALASLTGGLVKHPKQLLPLVKTTCRKGRWGDKVGYHFVIEPTPPVSVLPLYTRVECWFETDASFPFRVKTVQKPVANPHWKWRSDSRRSDMVVTRHFNKVEMFPKELADENWAFPLSNPLRIHDLDLRRFLSEKDLRE